MNDSDDGDYSYDSHDSDHTSSSDDDDISSDNILPSRLRSRAALIPINKMLNNESAEEFGRLVKQLERNSRKNAAQIIQSVNKKLNAANNCSSDDD